MVDYGERLSWAMGSAVSIHDLAKHLRISYQAVKKVVDGKTRAFAVDNHHRAAEYLNIDARWLALGEGSARPTPPTALVTGESPAPWVTDPDPRAANDQSIDEATRILLSLPEDRRRTAVEVLKLFAGDR